MKKQPTDLSRYFQPLNKRELPFNHRRWTGNDTSRRCHHGVIPISENPLFIELRWKKSKHATVKLVGRFAIDVAELVQQDYAAEDPSGGIRLKFLHEHDGRVCIGRGFRNKKKIPVGRA